MLSVFHPISCAALIGHVTVCVWVYNRLHASGLPSRLVQRMEKWVALFTAVTSCLFVLWIAYQGPTWFNLQSRGLAQWISLWTVICWLTLSIVGVAWAARQWLHRVPARLLSNDTERLDLRTALGHRAIGDPSTARMAALPGNQVLDVRAHHKILLPRHLPRALDGLRIAQVTDLHMMGHFTLEFYQAAIDHVNAWNPDLIMITGDLVDHPDCIAWIPETLGRLRGPLGRFAILGNHDQRLPDVPKLRRALTDCGIEDLGGRCVVRAIRDVPVLLAGNECPWFGPAPQITWDGRERPPFSILMSHSPDQFPWARQQGFDLMLAGHTHGGQIRFPAIGPLICPSRFGVWYASGLFERTPTLMHVSRGLSGVHPLRFHCPPELTLLELRCSGSRA